MPLMDIIHRFFGKEGKTAQGKDIEQRHRDYMMKGETFSVETEISEALADLLLMGSSFPISGDSERASWLDSVSDTFMRTTAKKAIVTGFVSGDCVIVPSWNGRNVQNMVIPSDRFEIFSCAGDEITSCGYVIDEKARGGQTYYLMQSIELVPREESHDCVYRTYVTKNGSVGAASISDFPEWESAYTPMWSVPNVDRLLIGRFMSFSFDPLHVNNAKGVPICFGAGEYVEEIHYLLKQLHVEFGLSEKAVMASKRMFQERDENGEVVNSLPRGRKRLFIGTRNNAKGDGEDFHEWAPDIRHQPYLDALDKHEKLVERAVGVSAGIISNPNDYNYENVDNVRKSQTKTMSFISTARKQAEQMLDQLLYTWNVLASYYDITPIGTFAQSFDWSDEYIETFADKQNAILAGRDWATDAVDYRMFLYNETPEAAAEKVAEIEAGNALEEPGMMEVA